MGDSFSLYYNGTVIQTLSTLKEGEIQLNWVIIIENNQTGFFCLHHWIKLQTMSNWKINWEILYSEKTWMFKHIFMKTVDYLNAYFLEKRAIRTFLPISMTWTDETTKFYVTSRWESNWITLWQLYFRFFFWQKVIKILPSYIFCFFLLRRTTTRTGLNMCI